MSQPDTSRPDTSQPETPRLFEAIECPHKFYLKEGEAKIWLSKKFPDAVCRQLLPSLKERDDPYKCPVAVFPLHGKLGIFTFSTKFKDDTERGLYITKDDQGELSMHFMALSKEFEDAVLCTYGTPKGHPKPLLHMFLHVQWIDGLGKFDIGRPIDSPIKEMECVNFETYVELENYRRALWSNLTSYGGNSLDYKHPFFKEEEPEETYTFLHRVVMEDFLQDIGSICFNGVIQNIAETFGVTLSFDRRDGTVSAVPAARPASVNKNTSANQEDGKPHALAPIQAIARKSEQQHSLGPNVHDKDNDGKPHAMADDEDKYGPPNTMDHDEDNDGKQPASQQHASRNANLKDHQHQQHQLYAQMSRAAASNGETTAKQSTQEASSNDLSMATKTATSAAAGTTTATSTSVAEASSSKRPAASTASAVVPSKRACTGLTNSSLTGDTKVQSSSDETIGEGCPFMVQTDPKSSHEMPGTEVSPDGKQHCVRVAASTASAAAPSKRACTGLTHSSLTGDTKVQSSSDETTGEGCPFMVQTDPRSTHEMPGIEDSPSSQEKLIKKAQLRAREKEKKRDNELKKSEERLEKTMASACGCSAPMANNVGAVLQSSASPTDAKKESKPVTKKFVRPPCPPGPPAPGEIKTMPKKQAEVEAGLPNAVGGNENTCLPDAVYMIMKGMGMDVKLDVIRDAIKPQDGNRCPTIGQAVSFMGKNGLRVHQLNHSTECGNSRQHMLRKTAGFFLMHFNYTCRFLADSSHEEYSHAVVFDANNKLIGDNAPHNPRYIVQSCNGSSKEHAHRFFTHVLQAKHAAKRASEITNHILLHSFEISKK